MAAAAETALHLAGAAPGDARLGLVLIHGRGASAADILGLGAALERDDIAFAAPEAPGRSWWPTSFLAPAADMAPYVTRGLAAVDAAIAALRGGGVPGDRIAIAGFSQGGCLALEYAARRGGLRAVAGLSAGLVGTGDVGGAPEPALYGFADKTFAYQTALAGTPAYLSVHMEDPHIPLARARRSAQVLETLGAEVTLREKPGPGHGIDAADLEALRRMLGD